MCYKQRYISVLFPCCSIKTAWDMAIFYFNYFWPGDLVSCLTFTCSEGAGTRTKCLQMAKFHGDWFIGSWDLVRHGNRQTNTPYNQHTCQNVILVSNEMSHPGCGLHVKLLKLRMEIHIQDNNNNDDDNNDNNVCHVVYGVLFVVSSLRYFKHFTTHWPFNMFTEQWVYGH